MSSVLFHEIFYQSKNKNSVLNWEHLAMLNSWIYNIGICLHYIHSFQWMLQHMQKITEYSIMLDIADTMLIHCHYFYNANSAEIKHFKCYEISFICHVLFLFFFKVQMHNGDVYEASIKDIDKKSDIATIKINPQVSPQHSTNRK